MKKAAGVGIEEPPVKAPDDGPADVPDERPAKVVKSDAEWRAQLTPEQYRVARKAGTERAFANEYWNEKTEGDYTCRCCGATLFDSTTKYDSGTGWPSFYQPVSVDAVSTKADRSWFMVRTEVLCGPLRCPLGPRLPRRACSDRPAVLPELGSAEAHAGGALAPSYLG